MTEFSDDAWQAILSHIVIYKNVECSLPTVKNILRRFKKNCIALHINCHKGVKVCFGNTTGSPILRI